MFKKLQQRYFAHIPFLVYTDDPVSKSFETLSRIKVSTVEQISRNLARIYDSKGSAGYSKRVDPHTEYQRMPVMSRQSLFSIQVGER